MSARRRWRRRRRFVGMRRVERGGIAVAVAALITLVVIVVVVDQAKLCKCMPAVFAIVVMIDQVRATLEPHDGT